MEAGSHRLDIDTRQAQDAVRRRTDSPGCIQASTRRACIPTLAAPTRPFALCLSLLTRCTDSGFPRPIEGSAENPRSEISMNLTAAPYIRLDRRRSARDPRETWRRATVQAPSRINPLPSPAPTSCETASAHVAAAPTATRSRARRATNPPPPGVKRIAPANPSDPDTARPQASCTLKDLAPPGKCGAQRSVPGKRRSLADVARVRAPGARSGVIGEVN